MDNAYNVATSEIFKCSVCGCTVYEIYDEEMEPGGCVIWAYCPNCGARIREVRMSDQEALTKLVNMREDMLIGAILRRYPMEESEFIKDEELEALDIAINYLLQEAGDDGK